MIFENDVEPERTPQLEVSDHFPHRVLIYTTCYNVLDGVVLTIRKIEQEILAAGGHVCILTTRSGPIRNTNIDGLEHPNRQVVFVEHSSPIPFNSMSDDEDTQYHFGFALSEVDRQAIADFNPNVIHITVPDLIAMSLIHYARMRHIPLMGTYHSNYVAYIDHYPGLGFIKPILVVFSRHVYNFLQSLYVPTPFIKNMCAEEFHFDQCTNLQIWGRGVDLDKFNPAHRRTAFREKIGASPNDVVVCFVGRIVAEKSPDIFANVIKRLHRRGVPYRALVIGLGPCQDALIELPNTYFAGWMSGEDLAIAYASSDIFLFPSAVETFGNVTLEAAGSGLPLVVEARCSGHLVNDGVNGYACTARDEDAFYEATLSLIQDSEKRKSFSLCSRQLSLSFEKSFITKRMLKNYVTAIDEFHDKYEGRHSNRDKRYINPYSFRLGMLPSPPGVWCIGYTVHKSIYLMWFLVGCWNWSCAIFPGRQHSDSGESSTTNGEIEMEPMVINSSSKKGISSICMGDGEVAQKFAVFVAEVICLVCRIFSTIALSYRKYFHAAPREEPAKREGEDSESKNTHTSSITPSGSRSGIQRFSKPEKRMKSVVQFV